MIRLLARYSISIAVAAFAAPDAAAQPADAWTACRKAPTRACIFDEAIRRARDDAPARDVPRFAVWESGLHERLSQIAEAKRDRALFAEAKRVANSRLVLEGARDTALQMIALAEVRAGFVSDAVRTIEGLSDPGAAPAEIAAALAGSGRLGEALEIIERTRVPAARALAWIRLARATRNAAWLDKAWVSMRAIEDAYEQSAQHRNLAVAHAELGRVDRALRTIPDIAVRAYQALALADIARLTGDASHLDQAKRRAAGLNDQLVDLEAWRAIVRVQIALGRLTDAVQSLKRPELESQPGTLADDAGELAAAYWIKDGPKKAEAVLNEVLRGYADRFWGPARFALAVGLADAGRFDSALLMAFLSDESDVDWALAQIAVAQAKSGDLKSALDTADKIRAPGARSPALARIAARL